MEKKLNNKEVAKVFALYIGQKFVKKIHDHIRCIDGLHGHNIIGSDGHTIHVQDALILLKDLSQISDEDAVEVAKIWKGAEANYDYAVSMIKITCKDFGIEYLMDLYNIGSMECHYIFQFLISRGYAVPLWFGIDHPCNGETAISLGLAIKQDI